MEEKPVLLDCHGPCKRTGLSLDEFSKRGDGRNHGRQYECKRCRSAADQVRRDNVRKGIAAKNPRREKNGTKPKKTNKYKHRGELRFEAVQRLIDHQVVADTVRTFNFVLRLLIEEQLSLFYGRELKTLPSKVRFAQLIQTTLYGMQLNLQRLTSGFGRIALDEAERLKANPGLEMVERLAAFHLLGLSPGAPKEAVKAAYKELARKSHPDRGGDTDAMQTLNAAFTLIMEGFKHDESSSKHAAESVGYQPSQDHEPEEEEAQD